MKTYLVMVKTLILLTFLFLTQVNLAQEIKFSDGQLENGLGYPIAMIPSNIDAQKNLNENIQSIISTYRTQDYCVGQYGYVQHTGHIQIHFYFNCIDMDDSKNEYHLFNLADGKSCPPSDLFIAKEMKKFNVFFRKKISDHYVSMGSLAPGTEVLEALTIDDFIIELSENGISVKSTSLENWGADNLLLKWTEMQSYLKTTFL